MKKAETAAAFLSVLLIASACGSDDPAVSLDDSTADAEVITADSDTDLAGPGIPGDQAIDPTTPYGVPWSARALQNHSVREGQQVSFRFAAQSSGNVVSIRPYIAINKSREGYAAGNGGAMQVQIVPDNGVGEPDLTQVLATSAEPAVYGLDAGFLPGRTVELAREVEFQAMTLDQPVAVTEGDVYHAVFTNVAPDAAANWASVQGSWDDTSIPAATRPSFQNWGILRTSEGGWVDETLNRPFERFPNNIQTPIMSVSMEDGTAWGNGYMEVWIRQPRTVAGAQRVRQTMTPQREVIFREIGVDVRRTDGDGSLRLSVETEDGELVTETLVPASGIPTESQGWVSGFLDERATLVPGETYYLVLSAVDGANLSVYPVRDGVELYGMDVGSTFHEGAAQADLGDGTWVGWDGKDDNPDLENDEGDLAFYFR
ncbi:MAG: hypothetical protein AAF467_04535 [Actinomycetota bacterium]